MADRIEIRGLRVVALHGVLPFEKERAQPFEIDVDAEVDLRRAGSSDRLDDTVSYSALVRIVDRVVRDQQHDLLERVAERICEALLAEHGVLAVEVAVRKLRPPVPFDVATAGVRIHRP